MPAEWMDRCASGAGELRHHLAPDVTPTSHDHSCPSSMLRKKTPTPSRLPLPANGGDGTRTRDLRRDRSSRCLLSPSQPYVFGVVEQNQELPRRRSGSGWGRAGCHEIAKASACVACYRNGPKRSLAQWHRNLRPPACRAGARLCRCLYGTGPDSGLFNPCSTSHEEPGGQGQPLSDWRAGDRAWRSWLRPEPTCPEGDIHERDEHRDFD
jgi:hypothetical protein